MSDFIKIRYSKSFSPSFWFMAAFMVALLWGIAKIGNKILDEVEVLEDEVQMLKVKVNKCCPTGGQP